MDKQKLVRLLETGGVEQLILEIVAEFKKEQETLLLADKAVWDQLSFLEGKITIIIILLMINVIITLAMLL